MSIALAFAFAAVVALETMFGTHIVPKLRRVADLPTATVLLLVLGGLLLFSFIVTTFGAMAYLTFRLIQHLQIYGRFGIAEWAQKTKQHFTSVSMKPEGSDDLDESGVLIAHEADDTVKCENLSPSPSRSLVESSGSI